MASRSTEDRLRDLENEIRSLKARLAALQEQITTRRENPVDSKTVQKKVVYDWQQ